MSDLAPPRNGLAQYRGLPGTIWALGIVSMLMDISSEMIHALLPVYMLTTLGVPALSIGFIEGIAEATASITKVFSGALSDWLGRRKLLAAIGYGLAAFTKPVFPLAQSLGWLVAARFIDRIGKGIRGAPRDALVADVAPPDRQGASFGLRQSLDTIGAFLGPLAAIGLMWATSGSIRAVFWIAVIPAFAAFGLILFAVKEPERPVTVRRVAAPLSLREMRFLGRPFWQVVGLATVFTLARFSEAFLVLRAQTAGLPLMWIPAVLMIMNLVYAVAAFPAGVLADRSDRFALLGAGLLVLIGADLVLAFSSSPTGLILGVVLWGLHMGLTQGLIGTLVAATAPAELRGTAFGTLNLFIGLAALAASVIAGGLWTVVGPVGTFVAGAMFAGGTLLGLVAFRARLRNGTRSGESPGDGTTILSPVKNEQT